MSLHAFWLGPDTVIAKDSADALTVWEKHTGEKALDYDLLVEEVYEVGDETELSIIDDYPIDSGLIIPPVARWERHGKWQLKFTASTGAWAKANGRCFLCSDEY